MVDNKEIIKCPACGKEMHKIFMSEQNINIDVCLDGCGGIFFDNGEFKKFDEQHEDISPLIEALKNKQFEKVDETKERICPSCGMKMVKNFASAMQQVQVDDCYNCGGKFLDNGELQKIRSQYKTEEDRVQDVMKKLYDEAKDELDEFKAKYDKRMQHPSLMTRILKFQYNKKNK